MGGVWGGIKSSLVKNCLVVIFDTMKRQTTLKLPIGLEDNLRSCVCSMELSKTLEKNISNALVACVAYVSKGQIGTFSLSYEIVKAFSNSRNYLAVIDAIDICEPIQLIRGKLSTNRIEINWHTDDTEHVSLDEKTMDKVNAIADKRHANYHEGDILDIERANLKKMLFPRASYMKTFEFDSQDFIRARNKSIEALFKSDSELLDEWVQSYEETLSRLSSDGMGVLYQFDRTRHYTPFSSLPKSIRSVIMRVNNLVEVDIHSCYVNIILSMFVGSLNRSILRNNRVTEDIVKDNIVPNYALGKEREIVLKLCGRFYRNFYGDWWGGSPQYLKQSMLKWFNQSVNQEIHDDASRKIVDRLIEIGLSKFVEFVRRMKRLTKGKLHTVIFRVESVAIERLMLKFNQDRRLVYSIHDAVVVSHWDAEYARLTLDEILLDLGIPQDGNIEKLKGRILWA